MAASPHFIFSPFLNQNPLSKSHPFSSIKVASFSQPPRSPNLIKLSRPLIVPSAINNDDNNNGRFGGGGSGGGDNHHGEGSRRSNNLLMVARQSRGDLEFGFKDLMKEVFHGAVDDMATRHNFGLGKLDYVLLGLVVGSIMTSTLLIASLIMNSTLRTPSSISSPSTSSSSIPSYILEPASYSFEPPKKRGTGGFEPAPSLPSYIFQPGFRSFEAPKKTVPDAATWAVHMGVSINLSWYQTLEFLMAKSMPPALFEAAMVVLRGLNNAAGGMSFVMLGRLMG